MSLHRSLSPGFCAHLGGAVWLHPRTAVADQRAALRRQPHPGLLPPQTPVACAVSKKAHVDVLGTAANIAGASALAVQARPVP